MRTAARVFGSGERRWGFVGGLGWGIEEASGFGCSRRSLARR